MSRIKLTDEGTVEALDIREVKSTSNSASRVLTTFVSLTSFL